jgi:hypothetical protein
MIGLFRHVKCEKPLFVPLVRRYLYNPLVVERLLTTFSGGENNYSISNRGGTLE